MSNKRKPKQLSFAWTDSTHRIVVAVSGYVYVGGYEFNAETNSVRLTDAFCIRVWGTDAGLGQLALFGPQPKTVLDFQGYAEFPQGSVVATLLCAPGVF